MENTREVMPGRRKLLLGLFLSVFGVAFEMIGIATALPTVMAQFEASHLYAWAFSTFIIGQLLSTMLAGRLADRRGPLPPMLAGFALFLTGLVVATLAPSVWLLLLARFIQGLGAGGLNLSLYVTIAMVFSGPERSTVLGWISFIWLLPAFVGPPLAAGLTTITWRLVFALMVPFLLVAAALALPSMRRVQQTFRPGESTPGVAWWAILMVSVAPGFIQLAGEGLGIWSAVAAVVGVLGLVLGLGRVMPPAIRLLGRGLGAVVTSRALQAGSFFAAEAFLLLVLKELRGLSPLQAGLVLTIGSVSWSLGAWLQSRAWIRLRRDQLISTGTALVLFGLLVIVGFIQWEWPVLVALSGWLFAGLGMGVQLPSTAVATMDLSGAHEQGANNAGLQLAEGLGNALMTAIAGAIYAALLPALHSSFLAVFVMLAGLCALGLLVTLRIGPIQNSSLREPAVNG
ncbi:MFS transporter [Tessaracoccus sp. OS52]|uniref:MFS transporter n=1 Tax=Tessaracoccus sp. OS52 TaxID=2886691 RepID=UPI001D1185A1|nr:MFS transporter [Tessaracoccus sp. OS52]MCC2592367.1 MFS transporter [Tessaracoccus sp. OS52]